MLQEAGPSDVELAGFLGKNKYALWSLKRFNNRVFILETRLPDLELVSSSPVTV